MTLRRLRFVLSALLLACAQQTAAQPYDDWIIDQVMVGMFANGSTANDARSPAGSTPTTQAATSRASWSTWTTIQALGVNTVWLSPVFAARSSHGYDATNYYQIGGAVAVPNDPAASLELFWKLVRELHLVGVNLAGEPKEVTVDVSMVLTAGASGAALQPVLGESTAAFVPETGRIRWKLPAMSTVMVAAKGPDRPLP